MLYCLAYFFGGAFFVNSIPHFVHGVSGRAFPTPFATPPGRGKSSAMTNVLWGFLNMVGGYLLIFQVGIFSSGLTSHAVAVGSGALIMAMLLAWHFGAVYGGADVTRTRDQ